MIFELGERAAAADVVAAVALLALVAAVLATGVVVRGRGPSRDGSTPWWRALGYFSACLLVSWATGVLPALLRLEHGGGAGFVLATIGCLLVIAVAYGLIWPIGTYVLDRPRDPVSLLFGIGWGVCEAQLLLAGYAVVEALGVGRWLTVGLAFALLSVFQGSWHALYWDRRVAPEHNDPAWNLRKVLLCHVPNLAVTLSHLAVYRSPVWFVAFQTLGLALSAVAMRFPRPARSAAVRGR